jgi:adenylate cyclase
VRRLGERIRISAQLIDAATGAHRWAERYDRQLDDIFAVQDDVVRTIVAILAAHVTRAEIERTRAKPPNSWQAYDYYLQAADTLPLMSSFSAADLRESRRLLERSLAIDAGFARSYALLAQSYESAYVNAWDSDFLDPGALDQAERLARKALQLDRNLPLAHAVLGVALAWKRQHEASLVEIERAMALNPNYVDWYIGLVLVLAGQSRRAVEILEAQMRLDPFYSPLTSGLLGFAHYMLKQYSLALPALHNSVSRAPNFRSSHVWLAATYAQMGLMDDARAEAAAILRIQPNYTIAGTAMRIMGFKSAKDSKHFFDGLRKAGLPEA